MKVELDAHSPPPIPTRNGGELGINSWVTWVTISLFFPITHFPIQTCHPFLPHYFHSYTLSCMAFNTFSFHPFLPTHSILNSFSVSPFLPSKPFLLPIPYSFPQFVTSFPPSPLTHFSPFSCHPSLPTPSFLNPIPATHLLLIPSLHDFLPHLPSPIFPPSSTCHLFSSLSNLFPHPFPHPSSLRSLPSTISTQPLVTHFSSTPSLPQPVPSKHPILLLSLSFTLTISFILSPYLRPFPHPIPYPFSPITLTEDKVNFTRLAVEVKRL